MEISRKTRIKTAASPFEQEREGGRKETLNDSERPEWILLPQATSSFYLTVTSFANGPMGSMRILTLGEGLTNDTDDEAAGQKPLFTGFPLREMG